MTEQQLRELQLKFEALCSEFKIPFYFSVVLYRDEHDQVRAMQIQEQLTNDFTIVLTGTAAFNGALHAMQSACGGKVLGEEQIITYKSKSQQNTESHESGTSN